MGIPRTSKYKIQPDRHTPRTLSTRDLGFVLGGTGVVAPCPPPPLPFFIEPDPITPA